MTCDDVHDLLSAYADAELDLVRDLEIGRHLQECSACAAALERTRSLSGPPSRGRSRHNRLIVAVRPATSGWILRM